MKKQHREAYNSVYMGWWPILDKYIPMMLELDPHVEIFCKEKYGTLRLRADNFGSNRTWEEFHQISVAAETASETICEFCGEPGRLHTEEDWLKTMCDRCAAIDPNERSRTARNNAAKFLDDLDDWRGRNETSVEQ